jgi:hypothetical protein
MQLAYHVLLRIPVGTVAWEEIALAFPISIALSISMMHQALTRARQRSQPSAAQCLSPGRGV